MSKSAAAAIKRNVHSLKTEYLYGSSVFGKASTVAEAFWMISVELEGYNSLYCLVFRRRLDRRNSSEEAHLVVVSLVYVRLSNLRSAVSRNN